MEDGAGIILPHSILTVFSQAKGKNKFSFVFDNSVALLFIMGRVSRSVYFRIEHISESIVNSVS